jgi:transcriptional regulator with XRE-family HTH domain
LELDLIRIGEKLISREKIIRGIDRILQLRAQGLSQQEAANRLQLDRTFISRLEGLGEVRKGSRLALIGFPIANAEELRTVAEEAGVEFIFVLDDRQRWDFVTTRSGASLFNDVLDLVARLNNFDTIIFLGSDRRLQWAEALWDNVVGIVIGPSPIKEDKYVDPRMIADLIESIRNR